ncbi:hypothetical protein LZ30DRAFT_786510 [Colletotrichum cereale]|nr:hypothetical protein LZ30DRAFT_786510 [Colletotrichum cereale]
MFGGTWVVEAFLQVILNLSAPANRVAISAERELAMAFYANNDNVVLQTQLSESNTSVSSELDFLGFNEEQEKDTDRRWHEGIREFPFISTTLRVGLAYDASRCRAYNPRIEPLGLVFKDEIFHHGMVVIDISDLEQIRYGIVAFTLHHMAEVNVPPHRIYEPVEDDPPPDEPVPMLEEERPLIQLSASGYMQKFFYNDFGDSGGAVEKLQLNHKVIDPIAMDCTSSIKTQRFRISADMKTA